MGGNRFEFEGRFNKAHKIANYARRHGFSPEAVAEWDEIKWEVVADELKFAKPPSERTIGMAVALLQPAPHRRPRGER